MANNYMWLVHRPSGLTCSLGKRLAREWYRPSIADKIEQFYFDCYQWVMINGGSQDDMMLVMEDRSEAPWVGTFEKYTEAHSPLEFVNPRGEDQEG